MVDVAVVGAGVMGTNHARVLRQVREATLTHVADPDLDRATLLAKANDASAVRSVDEVIGRVQAAIVATATPDHHATALALIEAGVHVLVEKPIATTVREAEELVVAAHRQGVTLMVGQVERFNPAVLELDQLVDTDQVVHLELTRVGPFSQRTHGGVVLDLMTHDLDLACALAGGDVVDVKAVVQRVRSDSEDLASALLTFANGVTAALTASRIGQNKIRRLAVTQRDSYIHVDLLRQDVTVHRVDHAEYLSEEGARYRQTGVVEVPFLEHRGEPLALELMHFIDCVQTGRAPRVPGEDGLRALDLAHRVLAAAQG